MAAIALTLRFIRESRAPRPRRFDPVGQVLVIVLAGLVTYGIIEASMLAAFSAAAALLGLLAYEPRRQDPLVVLAIAVWGAVDG